MNINCTVQPHAILPTYATDGSAALDVYASEDVLVWGSDQPATLVPTGVTFAIPPGHAMLVFPRSGHAVKRGLRLATGASVIDPDYRGELFIPLVSDHPLEQAVLVKAGDRIAQVLIVPAPRIVLGVVNELPATARGAGGFGSTGAA